MGLAISNAHAIHADNGNGKPLCNASPGRYASMNSFSETDRSVDCKRCKNHTVAKQEKLSGTMVSELLYGRDGSGLILTDDSIMIMTATTEKALVARGLVHPVKSILTDKGVQVMRALLAERKRPAATDAI